MIPVIDNCLRCFYGYSIYGSDHIWCDKNNESLSPKDVHEMTSCNSFRDKVR